MGLGSVAGAGLIREGVGPCVGWCEGDSVGYVGGVEQVHRQVPLPAAPPPCIAAPRPPGTCPAPAPSFSRRRTWLPSTRRARSAVGWAPCPPPSAWGSGAASLRHRRLGEGGWLGSPPGALCTRARPRSTACTRQLRSPPPFTERLFAPSCSSPEKLIRAIKEEPLSPQGVLDHKYSLSHEEPGAHLGDAKACSE